MGKAESDKLGERLSAYLDGELDRREHAAVEALLKSSEAARQRLTQLRRISGAVSELPRHDAPPSIVEDVMRAVEREDLLGRPLEARSGARAIRVFASLLAAAAIVFLSVTVGLRVVEQMSPTRGGGELASNTVEKQAAPPAYEGVVTVDQKLRAGAGPDELASHRFANEPNVLELAFADPAQRRLAYERMLSAVSADGRADLSAARHQAVGATKTQAVPPSGFYIPGRTGVNYDDADAPQLLVHVPRSKLRELLSDRAAGDGAGAPDTVRLTFGSLQTSDLTQARQWLGEVVQDENRAARDASAAKRPAAPTPEEGVAALINVLTDPVPAAETAEAGADREEDAASSLEEPGSLARARQARLRESASRGAAAAADADSAGGDDSTDLITFVIRFIDTRAPANGNHDLN